MITNENEKGVRGQDLQSESPTINSINSVNPTTTTTIGGLGGLTVER
jgi:hypothetical protein